MFFRLTDRVIGWLQVRTLHNGAISFAYDEDHPALPPRMAEVLMTYMESDSPGAFTQEVTLIHDWKYPEDVVYSVGILMEEAGWPCYIDTKRVTRRRLDLLFVGIRPSASK